MAKTKAELGNALKQLTYEKPFDRISVSDITAKCNLNRQTFYYHFQDKFECLEWIYRNECLFPLKKEFTSDNWHQCIERILLIMVHDKEFYLHSIKSNPRVFMNLFMESATNVLSDLIENYNNDYYEGLEVEFVSNFFSMGIMGIIMDWVFTGMKTHPSRLISQLKAMAKSISNRREIK